MASLSGTVAALLKTGLAKLLNIGSEFDVTYVISTCLDKVEYDSVGNILTVRFKESQSVYNYYGVPDGVYKDLVDAQSVGRQYNFDVKQGGYSYRRIA